MNSHTTSRIGHLLERLVWAAPVSMILSAAAVAVCFYFIQAKPLADAGALARQHDAAERVITKMENMVSQIERVVLTTQDWSRDGLASIDDPAGFNRLMVPVIQQRGIISSIHLATGSGREIMLLKTAEGWKNRITDVEGKGRQQRWLAWNDIHSAVTEEWKEQDYDPRKRPWFSGAMTTPENRIHWTAPYIFQSTRDPGITASVRWTDKKTGQQLVVAFDVMLTDISRFTTKLKYGEHGQVALLTSDGKVLGLPGNSGFDTDEALRKAVLQEPGKTGLTVLQAAVSNLSARTGATTTEVTSETGEKWSAGLHHLSFRNQDFRVATMAPAKDFSPWSARLAILLFSLLATVMISGFAMSRRITSEISQPLRKVFEELETSNNELKIRMAHASAIAEMAPRLQMASDFETLGHTLLTGLAERLALGQGSLYRVDEGQRKLFLCSGHARTARAMPPVISYGEGLPGQCAVEKKPILLENPGAGYLDISSVLGSCSPSAILLLPVIHNNALTGVIELAVLEPIDQNRQALLDSLLPMLALCMKILERNQRTQGVKTYE